jgi:signal peptidase I
MEFKKRYGTILIMVLAVTACAVYFSPYRLGMVSGRSMTPALQSGQLMLIDRSYYRKHPVQRGDIVFLRVKDTVYVKRVYALPGDQVVQLHTADGAPDMIISAEQLDKARRRILSLNSGSKLITVTIKPDEVYLLGDAGMLSVDSRDFGPVPLADIIGKARPIFGRTTLAAQF